MARDPLKRAVEKRDKSVAREQKAAAAFAAKPNRKTLKAKTKTRSVRAGRTRKLVDTLIEKRDQR